MLIQLYNGRNGLESDVIDIHLLLNQVINPVIHSFLNYIESIHKKPEMNSDQFDGILQVFEQYEQIIHTSLKCLNYPTLQEVN